MGLSRNKVAVSEGAAGSPPFYGERKVSQKTLPCKFKRFKKTKNASCEYCCSIFSDEELLRKKLVLQTQRVHLFPFRTQKLSSAVVKILGWKRPGKIAQCQHSERAERSALYTANQVYETLH